jgi:hypothetical protein
VRRRPLPPPPPAPPLQARCDSDACACADLGVELCGQKLTWDDVRPFKLQFRIFRGRQRSGRIAPQDLVAYSIKMQEAKRRLGMVRDVVNTGRAQFVASRSSYPDYPVCASPMTRRTRGRKPSFLARSFALDERGAPARTLNGEIAHRDMEIAAAKMQALARGRALRRNPPLPLRRSNSRGVRVAPTAEDTGQGRKKSPLSFRRSNSRGVDTVERAGEGRKKPPILRRSNSRGVRAAPTAEDTVERAGEGPSTSSTFSSGPDGPPPGAIVRREGAEETTLNGSGSYHG